MFISSQLFQTTSPGHANHPYGGMDNAHNSHCGNSVLGKRRRNTVHDESIDISVSKYVMLHHHMILLCSSTNTLSPRKIKPTFNTKITNSSNDTVEISLPSLPLNHEDHVLELDIYKDRGLNTAPRREAPRPAKTRRRVLFVKNDHTTTSTVTIIAPSMTHRGRQIAPCHICHSSPRLVTDLHRYVDCELCCKRTCVVCIRTCEARCGGREVCGTCCIEKGKDGDAHCLDCLQTVEDHEMEG